MEVRAEVYGHEPASFQALAQHFSPAERRARARRAFLPLLLGALISLPIPGWHFIGVPGFLVAAFLVARKRRRQELHIESLSGRCPACGGDQTLTPSGLGELPASLPCPGCGEYLQISVLR